MTHHIFRVGGGIIRAGATGPVATNLGGGAAPITDLSPPFTLVAQPTRNTAFVIWQNSQVERALWTEFPTI